MSDNVGRDVLIFLGGTGVGAFIAHTLLKDKFAKLADEEIQSVREVYEKKLNPTQADEDEKVDEVVKVSNLYMTKSKNDSINYTDFHREKVKVVDDSTGGYDSPPEDPPIGTVEYKEAYVITREDFDNTAGHYDKITINYYDVDDILTDEQEVIIPDVESVIGNEALECFGQDLEDPDVVYVRNDRLASDYEITRIDGSYQVIVLGMDE